MTSIVRNATSLCDDDGRGLFVPDTVPAEPFDTYWVEAARKAFLRRWHDEHGDAIDTATEIYK